MIVSAQDKTNSDKSPANWRSHAPSWIFIIIVLVVASIATRVFIMAGVYNIGADAPHTPPVFWVLRTLRDRSIAVYAHGIIPPRDLSNPQRIETGAGLYSEMRSGCHMAPGMEKTEISQGLYPQAPELSQAQTRTPAEEFWIIKHGVKLSAMPAWGRTHNDDLIWDMVAFIRTLPRLTPIGYQGAVKNAPADHGAIMHDMRSMKPGPS